MTQDRTTYSRLVPGASPGTVGTSSRKASVSPARPATAAKVWLVTVSRAAPSALAPYSSGWRPPGTYAATALWCRTAARAPAAPAAGGG